MEETFAQHDACMHACTRVMRALFDSQYHYISIPTNYYHTHA
uniref:Bm13277 n=1 Tax=Brugia malayi TaxID=6279 RepID=A0A1I9G367_BRUMA|nr:Bm13277 [Brugia malayi]